MRNLSWWVFEKRPDLECTIQFIKIYCIFRKKKKKNKADDMVDYAKKSKDDEAHQGSSSQYTEDSSVRKTAAELAYEKSQEKRVCMIKLTFRNV